MSRQITLELVCREAGIEQRIVRQWIERDWLRPAPVTADEFAFEEIDLARLRLLRELHALQLGEAGVPVVLSLLDQLYDTRRSLGRLREALDAAPEPARLAIVQTLRRG
ncbi:chaperone modulatory protein CbpM [Endobacter medicaginis]|uniref:Chaperone modulatory protein CbpM n=1 Tax=Endobacter medicaginis TaxID=1181271 RepID=A0A850NJC4_9PROT|nr:chaperone modulator CbpM [Endobacter medicaginis]MBB3173578.1 chaperone modulatory protein CbpM [Endobacter medicaginis]MCX5475788.1 hypothetical protein [Endobacter medicaginis]NVN29713.1 hypothetical protein [Endobacter medicaginis]